MRLKRPKKSKRTLVSEHRAIGISLAVRSGDDIRIQSNPIAMRQSSRDTSNHFQRDSQQPEKSQ